MQRERRRDPYPWTWEIPLAAALVAAVVIVVGIQLGRSVANLIVGAGWTWPTGEAASDAAFETGSPIGTAFWTSLPGVLGGDSGAGITGAANPAELAGRGLLWGSMTATELALLAVTAWAGIGLYLRWGPGRMRGMATVAEAEKLLGVTRLRKVAPIVRPDLHGKHADAALPPVRRAAVLRAEPGDPDPTGSPIGRGLATRWLRTDRATTVRRTKEKQ